jgi:hypothetical protein
MGFARGGMRAATGGTGRGGRGSGGGGRGGMFSGGPVDDFEPVPKERRGRTIRRILRFFGPYRPQIAVVLTAILLTSFIGLINPYLLKLLIDEAIPRRDFGLLNLFVGLMIALPIVSGLIGCGPRCTRISRRCRCASSPRRGLARSRAASPTTSVVSSRS